MKAEEIRLRIAVVLGMLLAGVLLVSNIVAVKIIDFGVATLDGGVMLFPVSYILGDVIVELFGKKIAKEMIWASFLINVSLVGVFLMVGAMPAYRGWSGQDAYMQILGFTPRIVFASMLAFVASAMLNNEIFVRIKERTGVSDLWKRSLGSSVVSKIVDLLIFQIIAFAGVLPFDDFIKQLAFAYFISIVLEIILTPATYAVVGWCRKRLDAVFD